MSQGDAWNAASIEDKFLIAEQNYETIVTQYAWSTRTITFSFPLAAFPGAQWYIPEGEALDYKPFTQAEIDFTISALEKIEKIIDIDFVYDPSGAGELKFGRHNMTVGGYASYPYPGSKHEVLISNTVSVDHNNQYVLLHEIGHALGLEHTHETSTPLAAEYDNVSASLMSYYGGASPGSFMLLDVLALLDKYGQSTLVTDDTYSADKVINRIVIADFGGVDSIDLSSADYDTDSTCVVDLERGFASYDVTGRFNPAPQEGDYNMIIAKGTTIERVVGSSVADKITGTSAAEELNGRDGDDEIRAGGGSDVLDGGNGDDVIDGGSGADVMRGGTWHDTYYVDDIGDEVIELGGEGVDRVVSSIDFILHNYVEILELVGSAIRGTGDDQRNTIIGSELGNILAGGLGRDTLTGNGGSDQFAFSSALDAGRGKRADTITDFEEGDEIDLAAITTERQDGGFLFIGKSRFHHADGELRYYLDNNPGKKNDATYVEADVDGNGKVDFSLKLIGLHVLQASDFAL